MYVFNERLKLLRKENNITQKQLAVDIEASERGIQHYELGERKPSYELIIRLCLYFNVSADYLLGLSDEPRPLRTE